MLGNMNNKKTIVLIVLALAVLFWGLSTPSWRADCIDKEFTAILSNLSHVDGIECIAKERDWYRVFKINDITMNVLLNDDMSNLGYRGWHSYKQKTWLGCNTPYRLDGHQYQIKCNLSTDSDNFDKVGIFINIDLKILILYYGRTYGI